MLYDKFSDIGILKYGKKLENKSLRDFGIKEVSKVLDKGGFNKIVESQYFKIDNNNLQISDFQEAKIELKVTPLKKNKNNKLSMKERTVLTMIDYNKLAKESWECNSLQEKAFKILFCFYIWEKEKCNLDYIFNLVSLWQPSEKDLEIIKQDWETIVNKIKNGKAHEISEGDTLYLGACTKGANKNTLREQPFSKIPAKQRAFSFKRSYMDIIYNELCNQNNLDLISIKKKNKTLEESLNELFIPFLGKTVCEIEQEFNMPTTEEPLTKNYFATLSEKILGTHLNKIEEFKKAGVIFKTIRIDKNGTPFESISFPTFKFLELIEENLWEESELYYYLTAHKFLFIVFEVATKTKTEFNKLSNLEKRKLLKLKQIKLWGVNSYALNEMEKVWEETIRVLKNGVEIQVINNKKYNNFPGISFNKVGHVRPHAQNSCDTYPLPDGRKLSKQCFWLNANFIKEIL